MAALASETPRVRVNRTFRSRNAGRRRRGTLVGCSSARSSVVPSRSGDDGSTHLSRLELENFALVEREKVDICGGFTAITGASGAGKSVLIRALEVAMGGTVSQDIVRPPASSASVTASIRIGKREEQRINSILAAANLPLSSPDGADSGYKRLTITRKLSLSQKKMRTFCSVNGVTCRLAVLKRLGNTLADINGQGSSALLRSPDEQLVLLDRFSGTTAMAERVRDTSIRLMSMEKALLRLRSISEEEAKEMEEMVEEVNGLNIEKGEDVELKERLKALDVSASAMEGAQRIDAALAGDGDHSMSTILTGLSREMHSIVRQQGIGSVEEENSSLELALEKLEEASEAIMKSSQHISAWIQESEYDPFERERIQTRLREIRAALSKYRCFDAAALVQKVADSEADLMNMGEATERRMGLEEECTSLRQELSHSTIELSRGRRAGIPRLEEYVHENLSQLSMETSRFSISVTWTESEGSGADASKGFSLFLDDSLAQVGLLAAGEYLVSPENGLDSIQFRLAASQQDPLRSLGSTASGGETARVLLALKATPMNHGESDDVSPPILVFDELDSSVGARGGAAVGNILKRLADFQEKQILCITHLPQVAAAAERYLHVVKSEDPNGGRALSTVSELESENDRAHELASMLGLDISAATQLIQNSK